LKCLPTVVRRLSCSRPRFPAFVPAHGPFFWPRVGDHVVQFRAVESAAQPVVITADLRIFLGWSIRCGMDESGSLGQSACRSPNNGRRLLPSKASLSDFFEAAQVNQSRRQVDMGGNFTDVAAAVERARPRIKHGVRWPPVVFRALEGAHAGAIAFASLLVDGDGAAVVGHENDDGVVSRPRSLSMAMSRPTVLVDASDHAVELARGLRHALFDIGLAIFSPARCRGSAERWWGCKRRTADPCSVR